MSSNLLLVCPADRARGWKNRSARQSLVLTELDAATFTHTRQVGKFDAREARGVDPTDFALEMNPRQIDNGGSTRASTP